jgi:U4/U6.U5 tri-snRNP-associated protein 2
LPEYLFLHTRRFSKNIFFKEKNPMLVNFPITDFKVEQSTYDLVANIVHVGTA